MNYMGNVAELLAHALTVDTRNSSLIFRAPGNEATVGNELWWLLKEEVGLVLGTLVKNGLTHCTYRKVLVLQLNVCHTAAVCVPYCNNASEVTLSSCE